MDRSVLRLLSGSHAGRRVKVPARRFVLGRGDQCDLRIPSDLVSRSHCELAIAADGSLRVEDLRSRNGTWVNEVRITAPTKLEVGDKLRVGKVVFEVVEVFAVPNESRSTETDDDDLPVCVPAEPRDPNLLTLDELVQFEDDGLTLETSVDGGGTERGADRSPIGSQGTTMFAPVPPNAPSESSGGSSTNNSAGCSAADTRNAAKAALRSMFRRS